MKTITVEELHRETDQYVRAAKTSPLVVLAEGKPVVLLNPFFREQKSGRPIPNREAWIAALPKTDLDSGRAAQMTEIADDLFHTSYILKCYLNEPNAELVSALAMQEAEKLS